MKIMEFMTEIENSFFIFRNHNFSSTKGNLILDDISNVKAITIHYERVNKDLDITDKIILRKNISINKNVSYSITVKRIDSSTNIESILIRENRNEFMIISEILEFFLELTKLLNL